FIKPGGLCILQLFITSKMFTTQKLFQLKENMEIARSNTCTINANRYCETLRKIRRAIQNRRRGMLSGGIVLLHDNARPHTAVETQELLDQFG
ncbi:hypothetical protein AVEN_167506-1, partial [Araneus ventricosus]